MGIVGCGDWYTKLVHGGIFCKMRVDGKTFNNASGHRCTFWDYCERILRWRARSRTKTLRPRTKISAYHHNFCNALNVVTCILCVRVCVFLFKCVSVHCVNSVSTVIGS